MSESDEQLTADSAQMIAVSVTEGIDFPFEELLERINRQTEGNKLAGRRWIAAVRRVHAAGKLTDAQADLLVIEIGDNVSEAYTPEPPATDLSARIEKALVLRDEWLSSVGEDDLVRRLRAAGASRLREWSDTFTELMHTESKDPQAWKVSYPSPEGVDAVAEKEASEEGDADGGAEVDADGEAAEADEADVASGMEQWRRAIAGGDIWTVQAVLDFAYGASASDERSGNNCIESILRSRAIGVMSTELSYLLLDRICRSMVDDVDPICEAIEEKMNDLGLDSAWRPDEHPDHPRNDVEVWTELRAAQRRREDILKARILRAKGEEEMARLMLDDPDVFRARMASAAIEWGVRVDD